MASLDRDEFRRTVLFAQGISVRLTLDDPLIGVRIPLPEVVWYEPAEVARQRNIGARIGWRVGGEAVSEPVTHCLSRFVRLADASDEQIVAFARTWGVLGMCMCHHGSGLHLGCNGLTEEERWWVKDWSVQLKWLRGNSVGLDDPLGYRDGKVVLPKYRLPHWEPIDAWRYYARAYRALWNIAIDLRTGTAPPPEVWRDAYTYPAPEGQTLKIEQLADPATWDNARVWPDLSHPNFNPAPELRRYHFTNLVSKQLHVARVMPWLAWEEDDPEVVLALDVLPSVAGEGAEPWPGPRSFSVLTWQLAAVVTEPTGAYRCANCGTPFVPNQKPRSDHPPYCDDEDCRRARTRQRVRRSRAKRRST